MTELTTLPLTIWLQYDGDSSLGETGPVEDNDVTWCRDKIFDADTEYVHAESVRQALGGHRCSELFGEHGLIAATMRALDHGEKLADAVQKVLADNRHLADGDDCTLKVLKPFDQTKHENTD